MSKTFEALMKAKKESLISPEETRAFYLQPRRKSRLVLSSKPIPCVAEEYQRMKHAILSTSPEKRIKTILFASSTDGEGNSTALINFAITLSSEGDKVLLVDANLRNPSFHQSFNVETRKGLADVLLEEENLQDVIQKIKIKNLSVITNGRSHSSPSTLFESQLFEPLIEQMKAQADWVLFDSAPINMYNDTIVLASKMDGVVMVVEAEKTRREVALRAKERLEENKIRLLGVILNRRKMHIPEWAYKMI